MDSGGNLARDDVLLAILTLSNRIKSLKNLVPFAVSQVVQRDQFLGLDFGLGRSF